MRFTDCILTDPRTANTGAIALRAGPLSLVFDPTTTFLRRIKYGDAEVIRAVYGAVRDRNWGTVPPQVRDLDLREEADSFRLTFVCDCRQGGIDFTWRGEITGDAAGTVCYAFRGEAKSTFLRNRIGLCVLHPLRECVGKPCTLTHTDGTTEEANFPVAITPHQPFRNLRALTYSPLSGVSAEVRFEGDVFETEDQRNWTDASFKTYSTPLDLPFPVEIPAGTVVEQSVTLTLCGKPRRSRKPASSDGVVELKLRGPTTARRMLRLGLFTAQPADALTQRERERFRALNVRHLRADICCGQPNWWHTLFRHDSATRSGDIFLECALHLGADANKDLRLATELLQRRAYLPTRLLVYQDGYPAAPDNVVHAVQQALIKRNLFPNTSLPRVYGGTDANFAELNRDPPSHDATYDVCFAANPQVHAIDDASLMENLEGLAHAVASARSLVDRRHVAVTPITLKPRFDAVTAGPGVKPAPGELPSQVDVRQLSLFGAAWTLGAIAALCEGGVHSATLYEITGWRGVMETEQGSPLPEQFPSIPGAVFPLYHVLADVGEFGGWKARTFLTKTPGRAAALLLLDIWRKRTTILCANLTQEAQTVRLINLPDIKGWTVRLLHAGNAEHAMREPEAFRTEPGGPLIAADNTLTLELPPYAYACVPQAGVTP